MEGVDLALVYCGVFSCPVILHAYAVVCFYVFSFSM